MKIHRRSDLPTDCYPAEAEADQLPRFTPASPPP